MADQEQGTCAVGWPRDERSGSFPRPGPTPTTGLTAVLAGLRQLAEAAKPRECAGALLSVGTSLQIRVLPNATAKRGGFVVEVGALARLLAATDRREAKLVALFHSHPFADAALSASDVVAALDGAHPRYPGILQVVIGLAGLGTTAVYRWEAAHQAFRRQPLEVLLVGQDGSPGRLAPPPSVGLRRRLVSTGLSSGLGRSVGVGLSDPELD